MTRHLVDEREHRRGLVLGLTLAEVLILLLFLLLLALGKLMRTIMAGLAEFERDLIRERVKSGLQAAKARGIVLGRKEGQRPSDKKAKRVLSLHEEGLSYRLIARNVGLSKNTVMEIVRRQVAVA
jgi:putative DNA-invertase from lambdoid prophage Rac